MAEFKKEIEAISRNIKDLKKNTNYLEIAQQQPFLINELIQLQLVELALKNTSFETFIETLTKFCDSSFLNSKQNKFEYLTQLVYPLALDLKVKDFKSNNLSSDYQFVKEALFSWLLLTFNDNHILPSTSVLSSFKNEKEEDQTFKALLITKVLSFDSYAKLLPALCSSTNEESMHIEISNENLASILTYLNIKQYFSTTCEVRSMSQKSQQIENVQKMLDFIKLKLESDSSNCFKNTPDLVLNDMLCIFSNYLQPQKQNEGKVIRLTYNDINEDLLNTIISNLCSLILSSNLQLRLWTMISEQKIKTLIESYNYDSFGNYIFTKLLLFLMACCPIKQFQCLVLQEVIARYPFLFYYAAQKGLYGNSELYLQGKSLPQMRAVVEMLDVGNRTKDPSNMFRKFMSKK